ncbi:AraC family transcriptional regulator [Metabacillus arenae]|uniref:Helix-turn-helix transcriptional regulator n=1 Tax=Metabacillus arenae TaxID=2771434 RepID=A0A926RW03_9BACI|nr:AraC family transcriptional regulator [Metabacillus arenae]MBD1379441.1 helix-turn-helix transcriptional regulator [Metabacillus arenae]
MLIKSNKDRNDSYGFCFQDIQQNDIAAIHVIGCEERTSREYYWDGRKRGDMETYIFQYTLSGRGVFEMNNVEYEVSPGKAFIAGVPGDNRYYLPEESEKWQFIYITLRGQEAKKCWNFINQTYGHVLEFPSDSSLIQYLLSVFQDTTEGKINDPYINSLKAYEFVTECYRYFHNRSKQNREIPENINRALVYMQTQYHKPLTLEDLATEANLSKYYFIKKFKESMHTSPLQYLTKYRIEKAFHFLQHTDNTIKDISEQVGFADANYFYKVFRKIVGTSPGQFRQKNSPVPFNHLIID